MRILVVDDDYVSRVKLKTLLGEYGDVDAAPGGDICLRMIDSANAEKIPYDLVTVDIDMPGMRGPELIREIMEDEENKNIRILTVTRLKELKEISQSLWEGSDLCLDKPFNEQSLRTVLQKMQVIK